jgi:hypothetical protein
MGEWSECVVLADGGVVAGLLTRAARDAAPSTAVASVMEVAPWTVRASADPEELRKELDAEGVESVLVTGSDGQLLGLLRRADLER